MKRIKPSHNDNAELVKAKHTIKQLGKKLENTKELNQILNKAITKEKGIITELRAENNRLDREVKTVSCFVWSIINKYKNKQS